MNKFKEIKPQELTNNPFKMIGHDWMLISAKKDDKVNTMTASWGGVGIMWNKNVATIYIRPQRYTKEFVDNSDSFSITVLEDGFKKELSYLGTVSGRDEDKIAKSGLTVAEEDGVPYFDEGKVVLICKKLYAQEMNADSFVEKDLIDKNYPASDFHIMYIGEITKVLIK